MKLVNVYITSGELEAEMIKAFLEAQGVQVSLSQESVGRTLGLSTGRLGEVQVLVPENQAAEARQFLASMEAGEYENSEYPDFPNDDNMDESDS